MKIVFYIAVFCALCFVEHKADAQINSEISIRHLLQKNETDSAMIMANSQKSVKIANSLKAEIHFILEEYDSCLIYLKKADVRDSKSVLLKGTCLINLNMQLFDEFKEANYAVWPDEINYLNALNAFNIGDNNLAIHLLNEIQNYNSFPFDYYRLKALVLTENKELSEARNNLSMCLDYNPYSGEIYFLRYKINRKLQHKIGEKSDLLKAKNLQYISKLKYSILRLL